MANESKGAGGMTARLLIEAIVRQITVLLAELATSGGIRAPLANVADRVFVELARELDSLGVSRSVSADMFGMALRTYLRRIRRYDESTTQKGTSLWEAVLGFIDERSVVSRREVLERFSRDEEALVRGALQDLTDSGLVFRSGVRDATTYRAAAADDIARSRRSADRDALDAMVWAFVRREGPVTRQSLEARAGLSESELQGVVDRLIQDGRIEAATGDGIYRARSIVLPMGSRAGWEAAVYDHFHAMVKTIVCKLRQDTDGAAPDDRIGGSTYSFEIWAGHPFERRVTEQLARFREATSALRKEVDQINERASRPSRYERVTVYMGQCVIAEEEEDHES